MREKVRERRSAGHRVLGSVFVGETSKRKDQNSKRNNIGSISFFFSNFPDSHGMEEMWKIFHSWGRVNDIYISPRRDKSGRRFGFVDFVDVNQPKVLEAKLDAIWIGTYKLRVNIPRFDSGAVKRPRPTGRSFNAVDKQDKQHEVRNYASVVQGNKMNASTVVREPPRSFGRAFMNRRRYDGVVRSNVWNGLEFNVIEEDMAWLRECFVGKTVDPEGIHCLRRKLDIEGLLCVTLIPMGGNLVLIKAFEGESFEKILEERREVFEKWFTDIRPWNPGLVAKERSIWLKFLGVPAHIWGEDFFRRTAQTLGTFVTIDESTKDKVRLDVGRALIFTTIPETINRKLEIKVNGVVYSIRVIEEPSGDNFNNFYSDWKYQLSEGGSSDEDESLAGSELAVPETMFSGDVGVADIQRLHAELSNSCFGRVGFLEEGAVGLDNDVEGDGVCQSESGFRGETKLAFGDVDGTGALAYEGGKENCAEEQGTTLSQNEEGQVELGRELVGQLSGKNNVLVDMCSKHSEPGDSELIINYLNKSRGRACKTKKFGPKKLKGVNGVGPGCNLKSQATVADSISDFSGSDVGLEDIDLGEAARINIGVNMASSKVKVPIHIKQKVSKKVWYHPVKLGVRDRNLTIKEGLKKKMGFDSQSAEVGCEEDGDLAKKAEIKLGKRPMGASSVNVFSQVSDHSARHMRNTNRSILRSQAYTEANKIWEVGKKIGLVAKNNVGEIIQNLVDMEVRDKSRDGISRPETAGRGGQQGSKCG